MDKNNKGGLADMQNGDFILNESATAVSIDPVEGVDIPETHEQDSFDKKDGEKSITGAKQQPEGE